MKIKSKSKSKTKQKGSMNVVPYTNSIMNNDNDYISVSKCQNFQLSPEEKTINQTNKQASKQARTQASKQTNKQANKTGVHLTR